MIDTIKKFILRNPRATIVEFHAYLEEKAGENKICILELNKKWCDAYKELATEFPVSEKVIRYKVAQLVDAGIAMNDKTMNASLLGHITKALAGDSDNVDKATVDKFFGVVSSALHATPTDIQLEGREALENELNY